MNLYSVRVLRCAELLQSAVKGLQVLPHLAQSIPDLARLIQNVNAAGKRVIAYGKGALDARRILPVKIYIYIF